MKQEWISINDRTPAKPGDYLVTDGSACMVAFYQGNKEWQHFTSFWKTDDVTHWMELPEPPKQ